jgi:cytoskeleton protein RodZ
MPVNADSLGNYLRRERELREVSLQDISAATKIQLRFLEALEEDKYDQLPPAPFAVGFLRAYVQHLSLEPGEVIAAYHARYGPADNPLEGQRLLLSYPVERPVHVDRPARVGRTGVWLLMLLGIGVVGCGLYLLWSGVSTDGIMPQASQTLRERVFPQTGTGPESSPAVPPVPSLAERSTPVSQTPVLLVAESKAPAAAVIETVKPSVPALLEPSPEPVAPGAAAMAPLVLHATATEDTWLRVAVDGGDKRQELLLTSGKNGHWEAKERFVITVGNVRGTRLTLNGKELSLPSTRGNVIRDFLVTRAMLP